MGVDTTVVTSVNDAGVMLSCTVVEDNKSVELRIWNGTDMFNVQQKFVDDVVV